MAKGSVMRNETIRPRHVKTLLAAMQMPQDILAVVELWCSGALSRDTARITAEQMQANLRLIAEFVESVEALPGSDWRQE